jgi:hypothetical protein
MIARLPGWVLAAIPFLAVLAVYQLGEALARVPALVAFADRVLP